jgi:hypothetical protein
MQGLRREASTKQRAAEASDLFERRFRLSLEQLVELYQEGNWRNAASVGGYVWARITRSVMRLAEAMDRFDAEVVAELLNEIPAMEHNTGRIGEKLRRLDAESL